MDYTTEFFLGGMWNVGPEADRAWYQATLERVADVKVTIDEVSGENPRFGMLRFSFASECEDARELFEWATSAF